jgi:hypothetical protein
MPSQFQLDTDHWGKLQFFAIRVKEDGTWESEWEPLRQAEGLDHIVDLIAPISYDTYQELRHRHARPYMEERGLPPHACLIKAGEDLKICFHNSTCPSYDETDCGGDLKPPPCYEASNSDDQLRWLLTRLFDLWRFGFHVILALPQET